MNSNLGKLIREMKPQLHDGEWVFCSLRGGQTAPPRAVATFREDEGTTIVLSRDDARTLGLESRYVAAWITLEVYSDLDAVGFLAAITRVLSEAGISCNVFSAIHHDHLFVPAGRGSEAVAILRHLSAGVTSHQHD